MKLLNELPPVVEKDTWVCMDVETFGQEEGKIHRPTGTFACLSIAMDGNTVYQIYDEKQIPAALKNVSKGTWIFHNALYDLRQLRRFANIEPRFIWDTMLAEQSMFGGYYSHFGLKDLCRRWLEIVISKEAREDFLTATKMTSEMKKYAAMDVVYTIQIARKQEQAFSGDYSFRAYTEVDEPCIFPILDMPGMKVDTVGWKNLEKEFKKESDRIEAELGINVMSSAQVMSAAKSRGFHILNAQKTTLKQFKGDPFIDSVMLAKTYRKATSTYGLKWLNHVEADGKVYSAYRITGAETGRMSSADPNMQNIPARELPIFRKMFIPSSKDHIIHVSDVSQQEPRILCFESKDEALLEAFQTGEDVHVAVAKSIFGDMKKSDPDYDSKRAVGKTINLGTSYGLSEYGLADRLKITEDEAARILRQYFTRFRGVFAWISMKRMEARKNGYIRTAVGRKVYINPYNPHADNNAINAPIQGGAADFTKMWKRKIWELCRKNKMPYFVAGVVHDELVSDVIKSSLKQYEKFEAQAFDDTAKTLYKGIPFAFESESGRSWGVKQFKDEVMDDDE